MNLKSIFSWNSIAQKQTKYLIKFCPSLIHRLLNIRLSMLNRAEFCLIFCSFWGHWSFKKNCFWGLLTFKKIQTVRCQIFCQEKSWLNFSGLSPLKVKIVLKIWTEFVALKYYVVSSKYLKLNPSLTTAIYYVSGRPLTKTSSQNLIDLLSLSTYH